jgi:hypothetical protein
MRLIIMLYIYMVKQKKRSLKVVKRKQSRRRSKKGGFSIGKKKVSLKEQIKKEIVNNKAFKTLMAHWKCRPEKGWMKPWLFDVEKIDDKNKNYYRMKSYRTLSLSIVPRCSDYKVEVKNALGIIKKSATVTDALLDIFVEFYERVFIWIRNKRVRKMDNHYGQQEEWIKLVNLVKQLYDDKMKKGYIPFEYRSKKQMEYDSKYGNYPRIERAGWEPWTLLEKKNYPEILFKNAAPSLYDKPKEHALALQQTTTTAAATTAAATTAAQTTTTAAATTAAATTAAQSAGRRRKRSKKKSQRKRSQRKRSQRKKKSKRR